MSISELYRAIGPVGGTTNSSTPAAPAKEAGKGPDFASVLQSELKLSQHAETRIKSRSIPWDAALEKRIQGGIEAASTKGSKEALIIADNVAVIANVKSRTIVTAMDSEQLKGRIFTNIDSAVLV